ncbi:MAG: hypothetical protein A3K83_05550 [Omnitrophica WOR_2 bacterium RBG_13_44_8b]|nr:MAG: hypothetical protein A3K83_05550 [Omnitrophica WOR_2 bacterium RBG_13_44_8b]
MRRRNYPGEERRQYLRLDSVFPVEFRLVSKEGDKDLSGWIQGFTNNIAKGGLCLSVNNLSPDLVNTIKDPGVRLALRLELPIFKNAVTSQSKVTWISRDSKSINKYIIGLTYEHIDPLQNSKIMRFARTKKLFAPAAISTILVLCLGFAVNSVINFHLIQGNTALITKLVNVLKESGAAKQEMMGIENEKQDLQTKIQALQLQIQNIEDEKRNIEGREKHELALGWQKIEESNKFIEQLLKEKSSLVEQLIAVQHKGNLVSGELLRLDKKKTRLEKANLDKMYSWLKVHQNPRTGLVLSFEGDSDIADWAFTYDQALVAQAFTNFGDFDRARKIFTFFQMHAKRDKGLFFNAYYCSEGAPAEFVLQSGPNIWLGIAIMQYTKKTNEINFIPLAEEIAASIMELQKQDKDAGIAGGPDIDWYSTEHNLDAYAFFNMLYKVTSKAPYREASERVLNWLVGHTYDRRDLPVKRGKGDSTIATDTYAWSVASIGPVKLQDLGMDPDKIMEFAEKNCVVEVSYVRPEGETLKIKGFDFAAKTHLARGGVVSSEWSAQMIMAFKIMADYYDKKNLAAKALAYAQKADEYLSELSKMIISSPSPSGQGESCLAYATQEYVDTGHGWFTPKGSSTGSLAGTTYALFAYYNYNPLELKE